MAVSLTSRFGIHRWDTGSDPINRVQLDVDNLRIESLAAVFREGTFAEIGDASDAQYARSFFYATDTTILYFSNGTTWIALNDYGEAADISAISFGASASAGSGTEVALANHVHSLGTPTTPVALGAAAAGAGSSATPAREDHSHGIASGAIATASIANSAVTEDKIANSAVTEDKIATGAVTAGKLGSAAVTTAKIADANVTEGKLASSAVTADKIGTGAVTPLKIASSIVGTGASANGLLRDGVTGVLSVTSDSSLGFNGSGQLGIASSAVSASMIQSSAVVEAKIATSAVTTTKIADANVTEGKLASSAVTEAKIATSAVTTTKIADANVTEGKLATGAVTPLKIASTIVGTGASANGLSRDGGTGVLSILKDSTLQFDPTTGALGISGGGVGESLIQSSAVTESKIATGAVTESKIGTGAVTEGKIGTGAVTPLKIASTIVGTGASANGLSRNGGTGVLSVLKDSTLQFDPSTGALGIAGGGVGESLLQSSAVTESKIATGAVTESKIGTGAVTEGKIGTGAVTEGKIGTGAVTPLKIASTIVGTGASANGLSRNGGTGVLSVSKDYTLRFDPSTGALGVFGAGYTTTATAAGTTTLTIDSTRQQYFTGTTTQTVVLPVATTMTNGLGYEIYNNSTGLLTVNTSGGNTLLTLDGGAAAMVTCINTAGGTGVASWDFRRFSLHTMAFATPGNLTTGTGKARFYFNRTATIRNISASCGGTVAGTTGDAHVIVDVNKNGTTMFGAKTSTSITFSSTTATVTASNHGYSTGDIITVSGASPSTYNGNFSITSTGANTFTYVMASTPATNATVQGTLRKQVAVGSSQVSRTNIPDQNTTVVAGDYITVDIDDIPATSSSDLVVQVEWI